MTGGPDAATATLLELEIARVGARHPRLVEVVADELRRLIVGGHFAQGERLVEARLAEQLGVSRNPVREALRALETDGFVELEPRRGARVTVLASEEVADLLEVRAALEELVAGLAAVRRTPQQLAALEAVVAEGTALVESGDLTELPALNTRFHETLTATAGNGQLQQLMGPLRDRIQWVYSTRIRQRAPYSWREHGAIVDAVRECDAERARALAGEHIARARAAFLSADGAQPSP